MWPFSDSYIKTFAEKIVITEPKLKNVAPEHLLYRLQESKKHPGRWLVERNLENGKYETVMFLGENAERRANAFLQAENSNPKATE